MTISIYKLTDQTNQKIYVGQTTANLIYHPTHTAKDNARWTNPRLVDAFGHSNFIPTTISVCELQEAADISEQKFIIQYDSMNPKFGYNKQTGGIYGFIMEEGISKKRIEKSTATKRTPEHRKKISEQSKGRIMSKFAKKKISKTLQGHEVSKETRSKISKTLSGLIRVNNGVINKTVHPDQIPEGFVRGMIKNNLTRKK